jgi:predicted nucleic acid binding AN1-type Zn finger protein
MGDLDSNEDSNANFEAIPKAGDIKIKIKYTDSFDDRKEVDLSTYFDPVSFEDRVKDQKKTPTSTYLIVIIIIALVVYWFVRRNRNKKDRLNKLR